MQSDTTGWMGGAGASFALIKNVQQILSINTNAHVQLKTDKDLYLLVANYNLLKNNQNQLSNNVFFHLRYNRKLTKSLRWEVYTQLQQNAVTNIAIRALVGTGPRFKVHDSKTFKLYAATAAMYEYEKEKREPQLTHKDLRNSTYVSFTWHPNPIVEMVSTTFYQPLFNYIKDFRLMNQLLFHFKATKHLSINTGFDYLHDAFPATGTPDINYTISNGITYSF